MKSSRIGFVALVLAGACLLGVTSGVAYAGEADIKLPDLTQVVFTIGGQQVSGITLMYAGLVVCVLGLLFGLVQYKQVKGLPVHKSMGDVSDTIWETCKTYLLQQGKFLVVLWLLIGACVTYYFGFLEHFFSEGKAGALRADSPQFGPRHPRVVRRGVVRHPHQHAGQQPRGLRGPQGVSRSAP